MNSPQTTCSILALVAMLGLSAPLHSSGAEPDPAAEHYYRGNALYNRNMHAVAVAEYKLFLKQYPNHALADDARHGLALSYCNLGKYAEAEPLLKVLIQRGKVGNREQLSLLLGECLSNLGKAAEAETVFSSLTGSKSVDVRRDAVVGVLETQRKQGKWKECLATAETLLKLGGPPQYRTRGLYLAAYACQQLGQSAAALTYLDTLQPLVKDDPMAPQVAFFRGEIYRATGQLDKAADQYAAAADALDGSVAADVYYRLGVLRFNQGNYDEAIAALDASLKQRDEGAVAAEAQLYLGRSWIEKQDFGRAINVLTPLSAQIESLQSAPPGVSMEGRFAAAQPGVRAALWLSRAYSRQKRYDQAAAILSETIDKTMHKGVSHSPLLPDLYFDLANALMSAEKFTEAAAAFARVLPIAGWPQMNDAMRLQTVCLHRAKDFQNSLKSADAFLTRFANDLLASEVLFVKAENLLVLNQVEDAAKAYADFLAKYPKDQSAGAASFRLGSIRYQQGRWAEALAALAPALAAQPQGAAYSQLNFMAGDSSFRSERWDQAVTNLTAFVEAQPWPTRRNPTPPSEPNVDSALIELAMAEVELDNPQAAMPWLSRLIAVFPKSVHRPLALAELGRLQYEAGDLRNAPQTLSSFVEQYGKHALRPKVEYYLGWVALKQSQLEKAEQHFAFVVNGHAGDSLGPDAALQLGLVQMSRNKFKEARATFDRLISTYPDHPQMDLVLYSLGRANARLEQWAEAAKQFQKLAENFPKSAQADDAVYEWAWCEKRLQRNAEAVQRYQYLIATYPESDLRRKAETELAELTYSAGEYDQTIAQLIKTLAGLNEPAAKEPVLYRLGTAYFNKGDFAASAKTFEDFAKEYPESELLGSALFQAGESRMKTKEIPLARDHFLAANGIRELAPSLRESVLLRLGETLGMTEEWPESAKAYQQFLQLFRESAWVRHARFGQAWALEKQGDFPRAIREYQSVIDKTEKDLLSARAQFQIGACLFAQKNYGEAIRALVPVHTAYPYKDWAAQALLETGRIMEAKGDRDGAIEQFKEVVRRFPDDDAARVAKERLDALQRGQ